MPESLNSKLAEFDLSSDIVCWIPYNPTHNIACHFTEKQWNMIVENMPDEDAFRQLLDNLNHVSACFLLKDVTCSRLIAFCFMYITDWKRKVVYFHGGGWATGLLASRKYLRGIDLIFNALQSLGMKIRTECKIENVRAERFIRTIGFKCFHRDERYSYFYLPDNSYLS